MSIPHRQAATVPETGDEAAHRDASSAWGRFARGLTLGALVGAAIAGSAIWERLGKHEDTSPDEADDLDVDAI